MRVLVFGAGSLGSLLGGLLARAHDVTLVGRDPHVERVRAEGLRIVGECSARVEPAATTAVPDEHFDLTVVAVKAFDTPTAADALGVADLDAVLSVQNGLDNERTLARALDAERLSIVHARVANYLNRDPAPFDLVFVDPPFQQPRLAGDTLHRLSHGWLAPGARVYLEIAAHGTRPSVPFGWQLAREATAGDAHALLYDTERD